MGLGKISDIKHFNSHAHVERDTRFTALPLYYTNFNSHAHVERDYLTKYFCSLLRISTHTLTWSVTCVKILQRQNHPKFQLTRSRGA